MDRRSFLKYSMTVSGIILAAPLLLKAEERRRRGGDAKAAGGALVLLDPKDQAAKALNYAEKHSDVKDAKLKTDRGGVKFEAQKCEGCQFFDKSKEATVSGKKAAPCQLFPGKAVVAEGWCTTWTKKV